VLLQFCAGSISSAHVGRLTGTLSLWVWGVTSPMHSALDQLQIRRKVMTQVLLSPVWRRGWGCWRCTSGGDKMPEKISVNSPDI
jgi:hypothetical protein